MQLHISSNRAMLGQSKSVCIIDWIGDNMKRFGYTRKLLLLFALATTGAASAQMSMGGKADSGLSIEQTSDCYEDRRGNVGRPSRNR